MTTRSSVESQANAAAAILIVTENPHDGAGLKAALDANHSNIVLAEPCAAAGELSQREFAVIICALSALGATQIDMAKGLRTHRFSTNTPIILLTPVGVNQALAMRAVGAGTVDCVESPADDFVLRAKVKMYVEIYRSAKRLRDAEAANHAAGDALNDSLTGLPTRALFLDRAEQAMRHASRSGGRVALAVLDLEQIQEVKETLGPATGDELLRQIALRFTGALRRSDTVARIGNSMFGSVLACDTRDGVETVTARLERVMSEAYTVGGHRITLGGGIGVALFPEHGRDPKILLERASSVMGIAKQNSLGHLFYDPIMHAESDDTADTTAEMNAEELLRVSA